MEALPSPTFFPQPGFQPSQAMQVLCCLPNGTEGGASSSHPAVAPGRNSPTLRPAFPLLVTVFASQSLAGSRSALAVASLASQPAAPGPDPGTSSLPVLPDPAAAPRSPPRAQPCVRLCLHMSCRVKAQGHQDLSLSLVLCHPAAAAQ